MYVHTSTFLHCNVQFRPQSGIFVHTFCALLSPSGPILWLTADIFMSCTALAAVFCTPKCSFGLRVEFLCTLLSLLARFYPLLARFCGYSRHFHVMYVHTSTFLRINVQFRPQSGILCHVFWPFYPLLARFWAWILTPGICHLGHSAHFCVRKVHTSLFLGEQAIFPSVRNALVLM